MNKHFAFFLSVGVAGILATAACGNGDDDGTQPGADAGADTGYPETDAQYSTQVAANMQSSMQGDLQALVASAQALQAAAPSTAWSNTSNNGADWTNMVNAWINARHAYEHVEGATAPIYPDIDISIDGRVEDFGPEGNATLVASDAGQPACTDMFGISCMSGLHAAERILWAAPAPTDGTPGTDQETPRPVIAYEASLGYVVPQSFPTTDAEALEFKNVLCAKIVTDAQNLLSGWNGGAINVGEAFQGLVGLMNESHEKVFKAGLHEEESRYSQRTMDDIRANLSGTTKIYALFEPWLGTKSGGTTVDANIQAGFTSLQTVYNASQYAGVAFPTPPSDWSDVNPTAANLATPFGMLYAAVTAAIDATTDGSVVFEMNAAATLLGLPTFQG